MSTVKRTHTVARSHFIDLCLFGVSFCVGIGYVLLTGRHFWLVLTIILPIWAIAFVRQQRRSRAFTCPTCQAALTRNNAHDDSALTFKCERRDTVWDTGFIDSADAGGG